MSDKLDVNKLMTKSEIDEANLPNSVLNTQQANRFIDLVIDTSTLIKKVRTRRINHQKGDINKLDLGNIVTEGADTTTSVTTNVPSESKIHYSTEKYRSAFDLTTDFTEDNLEGRSIRDTLLTMFSKRISIDSEMAFIEGDESLTTGDLQSKENNLLGPNDGIVKILTDNTPAAQQINAGGKASSKKLFYDMKRKIPSRYRVAKPAYRFLTPTSVYDKWMWDISEVETGAGDTATQGNVNRSPLGIPMVDVPLMPEDLSIGTSVSDGTKIILTPLQNLIYFIQRDITIEWDRQPRKDMWEVTIHFRADFQVENRDMCVIAHNVSESGTDYAG